MRTLAITQNITVDGAVEMLGDWFNAQGQGDDGNADMVEQLHRESEESDAILLGRRTFEDMRGYWPLQTDDTTGVTAHLNQVAKYVVSSTITDPAWDGTTVIDDDVLDRVRALKQEPGKDIVVTGSIQLCHDLIRAGLVDQYRLFTTPSSRAVAADCSPTASKCRRSNCSNRRPTTAASPTPATHRGASSDRCQAASGLGVGVEAIPDVPDGAGGSSRGCPRRPDRGPQTYADDAARRRLAVRGIRRREVVAGPVRGPQSADPVSLLLRGGRGRLARRRLRRLLVLG